MVSVSLVRKTASFAPKILKRVVVRGNVVSDLLNENRAVRKKDRSRVCPPVTLLAASRPSVIELFDRHETIFIRVFQSNAHGLTTRSLRLSKLNVVLIGETRCEKITLFYYDGYPA